MQDRQTGDKRGRGKSCSGNPHLTLTPPASSAHPSVFSSATTLHLLYANSTDRACRTFSFYTLRPREKRIWHWLELGGKSLSRCQCRLTRRSCRIRLACSRMGWSVSGAVVRGTRLVPVFATLWLWEALCGLPRLHL